MKKLLLVFPHGVLITPQNCNQREKESNVANEVFTKSICNIRDKLDELDQIKVKIEHRDGDNMAFDLSSLHQFIHKQQSIISEAHTVIEIDLKICQQENVQHDQLIEEEKNAEDQIAIQNDDRNQRSFHVKSLEIEWEGKSSFMHVFIETTNIVKLEEAKTNIKCQKIMFASASHEFRTPLNAIMNSYCFIDDNFK
jgi:signal transduction histidine kinase